MAALSSLEDREKTTAAPARRHGLSFRLMHLMLLVVACGLLCWFVTVSWYAIGPAAVVLVLLGLLIACVATAVVFVRGQSALRDSLVAVLAIASQRDMPLDSALEAFAEQCGLMFRNRVLSVADALKAGMPLPEALDRIPGVLPHDAELLIRVGWEAGIAGEALAEAEARRASRPRWIGIAGRIAYLMFVLIAFEGLTAFMMYFITPRFETIFAEFGVPLPPDTVAAIGLAHAVTGLGYVLAVLFIVQGFVLLVLPFGMGGLLSDLVPLFDRIFLRRHTALILRSLALAVENGKPLPGTIVTMSRHYPRTWVRDRLKGVAIDLHMGKDWSDALFTNGLINRSSKVLLDASVRVGNLPWALRETADTGERRLAFRLHAWVQVISAAMVLAISLLVFFATSSYFHPIVTLIRRLSG